MTNCPFCFGEHGTMDKERVFTENQFAYVVYSRYPVTEKHALIIPKAHENDYLLLLNREIIACHDLLYYMASLISAEDETVTGFNVGVNIGKDAGQSVFHVHIHLIPRRKGDVENPIGGVRNIIPGTHYQDVEKIPNSESREAMKEIETGEGLERIDDEDLYATGDPWSSN